MEDVRVSGSLVIPGTELEIRTARSSGPGGQGVNTTESKVELRWSIRDSAAVTETQRARLMDRLAGRLTADGVLVLQGSEHRSQHRNRAAVLARLRALVAEAVAPPVERRATRPTRAARRRRLEQKKRRGELKRLRRPPEGA